MSVLTNALPRAGTTVSYALDKFKCDLLVRFLGTLRRLTISFKIVDFIKFIADFFTFLNLSRQPVQSLLLAQTHFRSILPSAMLCLQL